MKHRQVEKLVLATILSTSIIAGGCGKKTSEPTSVKYPLMTVKTGDVTLENLYTASIQGKQDIEIMPQVTGFITKLCVTEGEQVKTGQPLFIIDQVNSEAALRVEEANEKAAEAAVATQELTYKSKQQLYADNVISQYDLQVAENSLLSAKAQLAQAKAAVTNAKQNLSYTIVKSPCNGVVGRLPYRVGTLVSPQMAEAMTTVSDNSVMYVYFSMTENQMLQLVREYGSIQEAIQKMPDVKLILSDGTTYEEKGRIESISGVIDKSTGAVSVRAAFNNPNRLLLSGGSCNVSIPMERKEVIVIPKEATYEIQNKTYCYKKVDGKAVGTIIEVNALSNQREYIVESGLQPGDVIVSEGAGLVQEGIRL